MSMAFNTFFFNYFSYTRILFFKLVSLINYFNVRKIESEMQKSPHNVMNVREENEPSKCVTNA